MFLRFTNDKLTRTFDLNLVLSVMRDESWGDNNVSVRIDTSHNYAIVASGLNNDEAIAIEGKILEAWAKRDSNNILEITK